jgi:hypothetical protein
MIKFLPGICKAWNLNAIEDVQVELSSHDQVFARYLRGIELDRHPGCLGYCYARLTSEETEALPVRAESRRHARAHHSTTAFWRLVTCSIQKPESHVFSVVRQGRLSTDTVSVSVNRGICNDGLIHLDRNRFSMAVLNVTLFAR